MGLACIYTTLTWLCVVFILGEIVVGVTRHNPTLSDLLPEHKRRRKTMGFRPQPTIYNLSFEGTELDGLHVRMSCCTIKENAEMLRASMNDSEKGVTEQDLQNNERILDLFCDHLVSWDLEDLAGQPVPTNRDGIDSQERSLVAQLITAWQIAMVNVPNLSKNGSSSGGTSEEESLGLGTSSENLGS